MKKIRSIEELQKLKYIYRCELAVLAGLPESTIKHWIEYGILPYVINSPNGHRLFERILSLKIIASVLDLKKKGVSLKEIKRMLD